MVLRDLRVLRASVVKTLNRALTVAVIGSPLVMACRDTVEQSPNHAVAAAGPIQWDPKSEMRQIEGTRGCDSWTPTWSTDNNLYTAIGDCRPSGVPRKIGMGFGRIVGPAGYDVSFSVVPTGDPANWDDAAAGAGVEALGDDVSSEKAAGMLQVGGRLWYWIRNVNPGGTGVRLKFSDNVTSANPQFTWVGWSIAELGYASFVQYGKAYAGGPSRFVYAVIPMRSAAAGSVSNSAYDLVPGFSLIRGLRSDLTLRSNWKYFCGTPAAPAWCAAPRWTRPTLLVAGRKFTPRAGLSWNPGLGSYMLSLVHDPTPATTGDSPRFNGGLMVFLSPNPWGPWETAFSSEGAWPGGASTATCGGTGWGSGERADIPTKYLSADGRTFYLFSSGGDCLSIARGVLP
jgi:hypothetical protein